MKDNRTEAGRVIRLLACLEIIVEDLTYLLGLKRGFFITGKLKNVARQLLTGCTKKLEYFAGDSQTHDTLLTIKWELQKNILEFFKNIDELAEEVKQEKEQTNELQSTKH